MLPGPHGISTGVQSGVSSPIPSSVMAYFPDWLATNPYFSAGFGLAGIGAALSFLRQSSTSMQHICRKRMLTSLEIPSKDHSYQWVMSWIIQQQQKQANRKFGFLNSLTQHFGLETVVIRGSTGTASTSSDKTELAFNFVPSTGRHLMRLMDSFVLVERQRDNRSIDITSGSPWETLTLTTMAWNGHIFRQILKSAETMALAKEAGRTVIYNPIGHDWRPFGDPKSVRVFESVVLGNGVAETIASDVQEFLLTKKWYADRGIPYRRGYLLHGPPGCGKSSFVMAMAGLMNYHIAMLNLCDPALTDERLQYLLSHAPPRSLLLLEDIDGAVSSGPDMPGQAPQAYSGRLTFSGLLNALDGVAASDERIIFMTTNRVDILPPALVRPGRVDLKIYVGLATKSQFERMFTRFFPDENEKAEQFAQILQHTPMSMAEVQGFFMFFKNDPEGCLEAAKELAEDRKRSSLENGDKQAAQSA
jgi:chaperone BCS1